MFYNCNNLVNINLSSFNTENVSDISYMFANCYNLVYLDISSFNLKNVNKLKLNYL